MGKSFSVYLISVIVFIAGVWLILKFGSKLLLTPEDLAGEWELTPSGSTPGAVEKMEVEQSGRYFNIILPASKPLNLVLTDESTVDQQFGNHKRLILSGQNEMMQFEGVSGSDLWQVTAKGPSATGQWTGRLINRTYPRRAGQSPATQPQMTEAHAQR